MKTGGTRLWVYLLKKFGNARLTRIVTNGKRMRECHAISLVGNDRDRDASELRVRATNRGNGGMSVSSVSFWDPVTYNLDL